MGKNKAARFEHSQELSNTIFGISSQKPLLGLGHLELEHSCIVHRVGLHAQQLI
jgi:hypothetical protein